ncbi:MAG: hypothetical protein WCA46_01430 [Actinocatenispora sp.]
MALPEDLALLNRRCRPGCTACPSGVDHESTPDGVAAVLRDWADRSAVLYVGMEALADPELLPVVVRQAAARGVRPVLMTRGGADLPLTRVRTVLRELPATGPFELLLTLDQAHAADLTGERLDRVLGILAGAADLRILFVSPGSGSLPAGLLAAEEVNRGALLVTRPGRTVDEYLESCAPGPVDIARPVVESVRRPDLPAATVYPVSFNALIFETTYFCNTRCGGRCTSCGPESSRPRLGVPEACRVIDQAATLSNVGPRCHFAGGEATIFRADLLAMLAHAQRCGFVNTLTTNGFWGRTPQGADRTVAELAAVGVRSIELSTDAMHQDLIADGVLGTIIRAGKAHGVDLVLRVCTTRRSRVRDVLGQLDERDQSDIVVVADPAIGTGRAAVEIPAADRWQAPGLPEGACADILNLVVTPDGSVHPCCNGSELCPTLTLGNVHTQDLVAMMRGLRSNVLLRTLVHAGPSYFAELMANSALADRLRPGYGSFCELCTQIFTDPEMTAFVREHVARRTGAALTAATAGLSAPRA